MCERFHIGLTSTYLKRLEMDETLTAGACFSRDPKT